MSKTQLKRELAGLSKEQLIEVILDAYAARKEIKEYFEFFLNPDVPKLKEKYFTEIKKELNRTKRGKITTRVSRLNTLLKEFEAFSPGFEAILTMYTLTLSYMMCMDRVYYLSDMQYNWFKKTVIHTLTYAETNERTSYILSIFDKLLDPNSTSYGFDTQQILSNTIQEFNSTAAIPLALNRPKH